MKRLAFAAVSACLLASAAQAAPTTVYDTSLPNVNGAYGLGVATTTTTSNGTVTTVIGPGGDANRVHQGGTDKWQQQNVGGNASVGITKDYARSGNGSAYFNGVTPNDSKADLEYYLSTPVALSSFEGASYDWYRDSSSTTNAVQVPSLRMIIGDAANNYLGYLIYEPVYNGVSPAPVDSWQTSTITLDSIYWSNNNSLNKPTGTAACPDCFLPISTWMASNPNATILGFSTGIGSGWNGTYTGAVDNISFTLGGNTTSWNFEVADSAVPEPATWAMMIGGFGMVGGAMRRRRSARFAAA